ncbi:TIR domain-containing protein [Pigmentiphaga litoralis]|uniref:TIR domain-containing protein n=1 Tax=Pigmentiphaga litoralis TaxID=516702 RepID=UPI00389A6D87
MIEVILASLWRHTQWPKKIIFVAFAIEDARIRDMIKGQSLNTNSPFEYVDMSVKEAYDEEWKKKVRTRILRSDGVLAILSENSLTSSGQKWEIQCAKDEGKPLKGIWAYKEDRTVVAGVSTMEWTWENIATWIDGL